MPERPSNNVTVGTLGGAVTVIIVGLVKQFGEIEIGAVFGAAMTTVLTFAIQYFAGPEPTVKKRK
jgi:Mg/Co/Ni transporter MgtE